jgi:hypothetical protein
MNPDNTEDQIPNEGVELFPSKLDEMQNKEGEDLFPEKLRRGPPRIIPGFDNLVEAPPHRTAAMDLESRIELFPGRDFKSLEERITGKPKDLGERIERENLADRIEGGDGDLFPRLLEKRSGRRRRQKAADHF